MKKISEKLLKIVMLISMIFSSFQTPIYVLANELSNTDPLATPAPEKGDMKLGENGEITKEGSVTVTAGSEELTEEGDIQVTKTVSKVEGKEGKYKVDFLIKGKKYINETTTVKNSYTVFVLDASSSMRGDPWTKAKEAAVSFSNSFVKAGKNNYLALVTFNSNGYQKREFQNAIFTNENLGNISTGTNYNAGLTSAYNYLNALSETEKQNAALNIIFISDGEPNSSNYSDTLSNIKNMDVNVYTFAYNLNPTTDYRAYNILRNISTDNNVTSIESSNIDSILESFVSKVTIPTPAGTNATLTDGMGEKFKIIAENNEEISGYGVSYKSANIPEITEDGTLISFYIEINKDAPTGWHQTNAGFKLEYTDAAGEKQIINCSEDPYVYWVQAQYNYVVNYYKDSIEQNNLLATETRQAPAGTIINESNVDINKYINQLSSSYEYSSLTPESITVTNDGETKTINILYVKVYGNLVVKHVDENGVDLLPPVTTTKEINTNYTTQVENIYGYTSTGIPSNANGIYEKGTTTVTYVYSKNEGSLEDVENNDVLKTQINPIIGANSTFKYVLTYEGKVKDYLGTATVTLRDTLPYEVLNIEYDNEACTYNEDSRLLTCTKTVELNENNQHIEARFEIEVTYKNLVNPTNLNVLNKVESSLTFGTTEVTDESEVTDVIKSGTVISSYVDEENNELASSVTTTGLIDNAYETNEKTIYGYTLKEVIGNETGLYTEEITEVIYVYTKNTGTTELNEVTKTGPENITSVDGIFNYTLTYNGKITDYVGNATLTLTDTLPYEIDEELSSFAGCTYNNKVLTCTKEVELNENNQEINAEFNLSLVFKNIDSNKITNKVESTLKYGTTEEKDNDETETEVFKGTVVAKYVDEENNTLSESITKTDLAGKEYKTNELTIYGYTLKEIKGNEIGKYLANEVIKVEYIYTKNQGKVENNDVIKTQINPIIGANSTFKYVLTYSGKVKDYVGNATVTLTDTLPYEVSNIKYDETACTYNETTKLLTCTKTVELNENNQLIEARFEIEVTYKNIVNPTNLNVLNKVESLLTFGTTEVTDKSEVTDVIKSGTVISSYVDEENNELASSVTTTGLIDNAYETNEKPIYGYTLKEVIGNETGLYTEEITEVIYVYTKNAGKVKENNVNKAQENEIIGANSTFKYVLTYNGEIADYVGNATVTLTDTLPYEVSNIKYDAESCTYNEDSRLLTCTKTVELNENNQHIEARFEIEVTYKDIVNQTNINITNKVNSSLTFGTTEVTDESEVTDVIKSGTVISSYVDEENNELASSVTTTGLIDNAYETNEKTIYGYTLKEVIGNETGLYTEEITEVIYVYTKNTGTTELNEVTKTGPENITSVDGIFNYTLTYNGKITDYVGNATLTLTDTLPYEIDEELSSFAGCTYNNKVLTCTKEVELNENNQEINAEFNLSLVFKNIDSNKITNKVESTLKYGTTEEKDNDETETEVFKGNVVVTYKNKQGESLTENINMEDLAGNNYQTESIEFLGYTLMSEPVNKNGVYVANQTIYVNYIYDKNVGTSEEHLEKQGTQNVSNINAPFEYKITYKLEIFDYVGEAKIILTDYLPYEIDEEKSNLGNTCKYSDGKLICEYIQNITNKEESKINIEENLVLYYKNITSNKVTNRIESLVIYGENEKFDEDEFTTEIPYGTLKVNYVTEDGTRLSQTTITNDLVGADYKTEAKVFDKYYLKEVIGEETGVYAEEETEVTYVYSLIPLPPQTGVENNSINYLGLLIFATIILVLKKKYL